MGRRLSVAIILSVSLVLSSVVLGTAIFLSRHQVNTVRVVGAATEHFESDIIKWRATIARSAGTGEVKEAYKQMDSDLNAFMEMMAENGIPKKDLTVKPITVNPTYDQSGYVSGYSITQSVYLISRDLDNVEKVALHPNLLTDKGVYLQSSELEYYSSQLSGIKKDLLAAATVDAKKRAEKIADSSGNRIARLVSARVGVFQITEPYSTDVSDYGVYNTSTKDKDITVTVNVEFALK